MTAVGASNDTRLGIAARHWHNSAQPHFGATPLPIAYRPQRKTGDESRAKLLPVSVTNYQLKNEIAFFGQSFIRTGAVVFFLGAVYACATSAGSWFGTAAARASSAGRGRGNGGDDSAR